MQNYHYTHFKITENPRKKKLGGNVEMLYDIE